MSQDFWTSFGICIVPLVKYLVRFRSAHHVEQGDATVRLSRNRFQCLREIVREAAYRYPPVKIRIIDNCYSQTLDSLGCDKFEFKLRGYRLDRNRNKLKATEAGILK